MAEMQLTTDIIEIAGFTKSGEKIIDSDIYTKGNFRIVKRAFKGWMFSLYYKGHYLKDIRYVRQLTNIYFALDEEKLIIKLNQLQQAQ